MAEYIINQTIRITTHFYCNDQDGPKKRPSVSYSVYHPVDSKIPAMKGQLTGNDLQQVYIKASDGLLIYGQLNTMMSGTEMIMNANLYYGFNNTGALQHHFEGTVAIGAGKLPPDPPPYSPLMHSQPIKDNEPVSTDLIVAAMLFPYMNPGREAIKTKQDTWLHFIEYNTAEAPATSLYNQLVAPAQRKDRHTMEELAKAFLENEDHGAGGYFENLSNIPEPFRNFPDLYHAIAYGDRGETYENTLLEHLNLTGPEELKAWVGSIDKAIADRVWQNYFSLNIIDGYNAGLFIQLNKIILVHNLLQKLYTEPLPSFIKDKEAAFQVLLKATVVLPGVPINGHQPVFPLPPYASTYSNIVFN